MSTKRVLAGIGTLGVLALAATVAFPSLMQQSTPVTGNVLEPDAGNESETPSPVEPPSDESDEATLAGACVNTFKKINTFKAAGNTQKPYPATATEGKASALKQAELQSQKHCWSLASDPSYASTVPVCDASCKSAGGTKSYATRTKSTTYTTMGVTTPTAFTADIEYECYAMRTCEPQTSGGKKKIDEGGEEQGDLMQPSLLDPAQ